MIADITANARAGMKFKTLFLLSSAYSIIDLCISYNNICVSVCYIK